MRVIVDMPRDEDGVPEGYVNNMTLKFKRGDFDALERGEDIVRSSRKLGTRILVQGIEYVVEPESRGGWEDEKTRGHDTIYILVPLDKDGIGECEFRLPKKGSNLCGGALVNVEGYHLGRR